MDYLAPARQIIDLEIAELQALSARIGPSFSAAIETLHGALHQGKKIILCGVGKSGNIAAKLAATLTSTGAPAVVLHPQDALHGDLGLISPGDPIVLLSYSGETDEIRVLLPHLKRLASPLIALTGAVTSTLGQAADVTLDVSVTREACPHNLAPTSSSTVMLVLGDALAMVLLQARGFLAADFALLHPGGSLGRALLTQVSDIMRTGPRLPLVPPGTTVQDAIRTMGRCRAGCVILTHADGRLAGLFTQGDFARAFEADPHLSSHLISQYATPHPITILSTKLAAEIGRAHV